MTKPFVLKPGETIRDSLRAIARHILSEAQGIVSDSSRGKAETIHDLRKMMKRWRALMRLLEPQLGEPMRLLRTTAGELTRALGAARDVTSVLQLLDDLAKDRVIPSALLSERSVNTIRERLIALRTASERRSWSAKSRRAMMDYLTHAEFEISRAAFERLEFSDIARNLARSYRRARDVMPARWEKTSAEALHVLRRRVVTLRYQMELVEPLWPNVIGVWVDEAQGLRGRLGRHQDLAVMRMMAGPGGPLAHWRSRLAPIVEEAQARDARAAAKIARRLFAESPKGFRHRLESLWMAQAAP